MATERIESKGKREYCRKMQENLCNRRLRYRDCERGAQMGYLGRTVRRKSLECLFPDISMQEQEWEAC